MFQIVISELHMEYIEDIISFDKYCFPTDYWEESAWKELLEDERSVYYAVMENEKIIGNVFVYNWKGEKDYVKIMNLAVHPEYRNQGLACQLLQYVTKEMKILGMRCFRGETRQSNKRMQKVFESCGYQLDKIEENYYDSPNENACKYILQL